MLGHRVVTFCYEWTLPTNRCVLKHCFGVFGQISLDSLFLLLQTLALLNPEMFEGRKIPKAGLKRLKKGAGQIWRG